MTNPSRILLLALLAGTAMGCGKRTPPAAAPAPAPAPAPATDDRAAAERQAQAAAEAAAAAARREAERVRTVLEARVFFDYDDVQLRADQRSTLDEKVRVLRDAPAVRLRIEGHADDRGSTEYNLALGSRRASAVVSYMTGFGIDRSRLETVSFGEERPLVRGSGEQTWSQNRRADFVITAGAPVTLGDGGR